MTFKSKTSATALMGSVLEAGSTNSNLINAELLLVVLESSISWICSAQVKPVHKQWKNSHQQSSSTRIHHGNRQRAEPPCIHWTEWMHLNVEGDFSLKNNNKKHTTKKKNSQHHPFIKHESYHILVFVIYLQPDVKQIQMQANKSELKKQNKTKTHTQTKTVVLL